jgi:glucose-6-phosphate 1-epimerase
MLKYRYENTTMNMLLKNDFAEITHLKLPSLAKSNALDGINIVHQYCKAQISLYGGQVLSYAPAGHRDFFWLSDTSDYQAGKAIRGGIPLCWPWFGANDKQQAGDNTGNHGFARQLPWQVSSINATEDNVTLVLTLSGDKQHPLWPNAFQLEQTLIFGKSFSQSLAMSNLSKKDAQYCAALHSYFAVSSPENIEIDALTGVNYDDKVARISNVQQSSVSCIGEIDRVYHSNKSMMLVDKQWQRKIEITSLNCQQWVLWNPGKILADNMADVHSNGENEYVCLEAANSVWQDLPAGKTITIGQEVTVSHF